MDENTAKILFKRAQHSAKKYGFFNDSEDLAQDVMLAFILKPTSKQTIDQAIIDSARKRYGQFCRKNKRISSRRPGTNIHVSLEKAKNIPDETESEYNKLKLLNETISHNKDKKDINRTLENISIDRTIWILMYGWGFSQKEVAFCFGTTESAISKRLFDIRKRIGSSITL